jgi:O-antigen ligase
MAVALRDRARPGRPWAPGLQVPVPALGPDARVAIAGLLIGAGIIGGMVAESSPATTAAAVIALAAAVLHPPIGLVTLAFLAPLRMPLVIPPPGLNSALVGAIVLGCIVRLSRERLLPEASGRAIRIGAPVILAGGFLLYVLFQQLPEMATGYASAAAHDIGFLFYQIATGFGAIVAAALVIRGRSPYPYLLALMLASAFAGVLAIITVDELPFARLEHLIPPSDGDGRATGPFGNPNAFGQLLAYATTLAVGLAVAARRWRYRLPLIALVAVYGYAMYVSLSRGSLVALAAGLIVLGFTKGRRMGVATMVAAAVIALVVYPVFVETRLQSIEGSLSPQATAALAGSDGARLDAVLAAPALFALSPVFGIGFGQYKFMSALVTENHISIVAHNWYGTVFAEQGLLGVVLWGAFMVSVLVALRRRPHPQRMIGTAIMGAFLAGSFFLQPPTQFQLSALPVIAVTAAIVGLWGFERPSEGRSPAARPPRRPVRRVRLGSRPAPEPVPAG